MVASAAICFIHREFVWPNCTAHNIQSVERVPMTQSGIAKLAWIVLMMIDLLATALPAVAGDELKPASMRRQALGVERGIASYLYIRFWHVFSDRTVWHVAGRCARGNSKVQTTGPCST
jgi:hypothetical protein